ncbi:tetratricopeptide repeat protein [Planctomycetes bacterium Pan216]|uniref:Tetratricopeptide repeat protein n=1 Tax=Kolteria novifilia TaxID=2527975 RepID=A0A518B9R9_9BACT|nr:tetratricopeptide repeat protein [Planctomycetes bacterium Pan216]
MTSDSKAILPSPRRSFLAILAIVWLATTAQADALQDAYNLWLQGKYGEAREAYATIEGEPEEVALGNARCLASQGDDEGATKTLADALEKAPGNDRLLAALAEIDLRHGRYEEALDKAAAARETNDDNVLARWIQARVKTLTGKQADANADYEWFIHYYNDKQPTDPEELLLVAMAAAEYARWNKLPDEFDFILNTLLVDALAANEHFWKAPWFSGVLLLEKYNQAEGIPALREALRLNPSAAEVLVSLGEASLHNFDIPKAHGFANQALEINPKLPSAHRLKTDLFISDEKTDEAVSALEPALEINPVSEESLARAAACHYIQGEPAEAKKIVEKMEKLNPAAGTFHGAIGSLLEQRRRFDLAEEHLQKAIEVAPHLAAPRNDLGMLYMRLGKEDEARDVFEEARQLDPFHVRVANMVKVLRHLDKYDPIVTEHYEVYVGPEEDRILGEYMSQYLEENHEEWCRRLGFQTEGRTKIEILSDHKWFSARVIGLPRVGTVGACTGQVVAMASPRSLRQPYNWARVLTHEVTHIITLAQTDFKIPHWYTEALAVYSEGYPRPQIWDELLVERVPKGDLFNLDTINRGFIRPKTQLDWQMAYCQSLLYAEFMIERYGEETLAKLLDAYRDGLETPAAIPKVFGVSVKEFEKGYREYLEKVVRSIKSGPTEKELSFAEAERAHRLNPDDPELAAKLALHYHQRRNNTKARGLAEKVLEKNPKHPLALFVLARMELSIGKIDDALEILEPALDEDDPDPRVLELMAGIAFRQRDFDEAERLFTIARDKEPGRSRWWEALAKVYIESDDDEKLAGVLERLSRLDADDITVRKKRLELASQEEKWEDAIRWANEVLYIDVNDLAAHEAKGDALLALDNAGDAVKEYEATLSLAPKNMGVALKLANALVKAGRAEEAKAPLQRVLKSEPNNAEAVELKKRLEEK